MIVFQQLTAVVTGSSLRQLLLAGVLVAAPLACVDRDSEKEAKRAPADNSDDHGSNDPADAGDDDDAPLEDDDSDAPDGPVSPAPRLDSGQSGGISAGATVDSPAKAKSDSASLSVSATVIDFYEILDQYSAPAWTITAKVRCSV